MSAKSKAKKSNRNKNNNAAAATSTGLYSRDPFPPSMHLVFRYAETFQFTTGTAGVMGTQQSMRLNSMFDPNLTGTGHQPYGFDTYLGTVYAYYRVTRCRFTILFTTPGGGADLFCAYMLNTTGSSSTLTATTIDAVREHPRTTVGHLSSAGQRTCVLKGDIPLHKLFGVAPSVVKDEANYAAFNTASPASQAMVLFSVGSYSGAAGEAASAQIFMEFYSDIYERIGVGQS